MSHLIPLSWSLSLKAVRNTWRENRGSNLTLPGQFVDICDQLECLGVISDES